MMDHLLYTLTPLYRVIPTWQEIYEIIETSKEPPERKKIWKGAVDFLCDEFGKGFFNTCGHNHPIALKLTINLYCIDELVEFTESLKNHKQVDSESYSVLLAKLRPRKKCQSEGIPFTHLLQTFSTQGFQVKFLSEVALQKNTDIELKDAVTGESIFVEVSQLLQSPDQLSIQEQHKILSNTFIQHGYDLPKACKQLQHLEGEEMKRVVSQIKTMKDQAAAAKEFVSFEDDFIKVAVAHPSRLNDLDAWCAKHAIQRNSMEGLQVEYNDTRRLVNSQKIVAEIKQLPENFPGLIYLPVSVIYFMCMNVSKTIIQIMEQLSEYPHCLGVVLFASSVGSLLPEGVIEVYHTRRSVKTIKGTTRHSLFIGNPCFAGKLSEDTRRRFQDCLY